MNRTVPAPEKPDAEWHESAVTPAGGVVVLVHGLNNHPQIMLPLSGEFRRAGYHTVLVGLSGHRGENWSVMDYASAWKDEVRRAMETAKKNYPELPQYVAGYSLGATILLAVLSEPGAPEINGGVFLAPAVQATRFARLLQIFFPLRYLRLKLPTMVPPQWRANNWTPIAAYSALAEVAGEIDPAQLREKKLCFILDPDDELISYGATLEWLKDNALSNVVVKTNSPETTNERHHLMFAPEARGESSWRKMVEVAVDCLRS